MFTDQEIQTLIECPKEIKQKQPSRGYKEEDGHRRCNLTLEGASDENKAFHIFIRQNSTFIENYSIGLQYKTGDKALGSVTLIRYNGPHGEVGKSRDDHHDRPHIHRLTAEELQAGNVQPQEKHRELTDRYELFEEALNVFFNDVGVASYSQYFPNLNQTNLFN